MHQLKAIITSTRPGRKGPAVADWFLSIANEHPEFETELLDLKEIDLPFLDEPKHPRMRDYQHAHTKRWSETIDSADAYVFVNCEYNHGLSAPLKNALDFLYHEWCYKPAAFVSYGGIAGGTRAIQMIKQVVTTQKMMPVSDAVHIPHVAGHINENGIFEGTGAMYRSAEAMLEELALWTRGLKTMRQQELQPQQ